MNFEILWLLLAAAVVLGAALAILGLGLLRRGGEAGTSPRPPEVRIPKAPARPGAGPVHAWFLPGGGRFGELRFGRVKPLVEAVEEDLRGVLDLRFQVGAKKKVRVKLADLPWPKDEALFMAHPRDPFLLMIDRPLDRFDPRYDRYILVPLGFMDSAGGVEAFLGSWSYEILANKVHPLEMGEKLLQDSAELAIAAGFAPPDLFRSVLEIMRKSIFSGRYAPYVSDPRGVPEAHRSSLAPPPSSSPRPEDGAVPLPQTGLAPPPRVAPAAPEAPPLSQPVPPAPGPKKKGD